MKENSEFEEALTYSVDIPQTFNGRPTDEWKVVAEFKSEKDAIKYAQEHFGADEKGMVCLISCY